MKDVNIVSVLVLLGLGALVAAMTESVTAGVITAGMVVVLDAAAQWVSNDFDRWGGV